MNESRLDRGTATFPRSKRLWKDEEEQAAGGCLLILLREGRFWGSGMGGVVRCCKLLWFCSKLVVSPAS